MNFSHFDRQIAGEVCSFRLDWVRQLLMIINYGFHFKPFILLPRRGRRKWIQIIFNDKIVSFPSNPGIKIFLFRDKSKLTVAPFQLPSKIFSSQKIIKNIFLEIMFNNFQQKRQMFTSLRKSKIYQCKINHSQKNFSSHLLW